MGKDRQLRPTCNTSSRSCSRPFAESAHDNSLKKFRGDRPIRSLRDNLPKYRTVFSNDALKVSQGLLHSGHLGTNRVPEYRRAADVFGSSSIEVSSSAGIPEAFAHRADILPFSFAHDCAGCRIKSWRCAICRYGGDPLFRFAEHCGRTKNKSLQLLAVFADIRDYGLGDGVFIAACLFALQRHVPIDTAGNTAHRSTGDRGLAR